MPEPLDAVVEEDGRWYQVLPEPQVAELEAAPVKPKEWRLTVGQASDKGQVREIDNRGDIQVISAVVPLAQLFGYATAVRSLSKGRATYTMEPHCFEVVSDTTAEQLLNR